MGTLEDSLALVLVLSQPCMTLGFCSTISL